MRSFNSISRFLMAAVLIVTSFLPAACASQTVETKPQASPDTTFARFTEAWAGQDYSAMYQLLSSESKLSIAEADFTERYAKIMQGIEASELDFEMAADGLARSDDQASATIAFSVQMDTLAGRLDLTGYTMNLVQETTDAENDKEKIWTINWSEELIFPGMGPMDKIRARRIEPIRGEILALVSTPSFDPNLLQTYVPDAIQTGWNEAVKPYFSSRFKQVYAPGSVFKLVTAAIGLNTGTLDPEEALEISGLKWRPDSSWGTYAVTRVKDPGQPVDLHDAFLYSDNIYFAQQALAVGEEAFIQGSQGFGIGEDLPVDYPFNTSQLANAGLENTVLLADTGYGQGEVLLSPLHLALFYSTLATEGNLLKPVLEYREDRTPEIWKEHAIAAEHVPLLTEALLAVVEDPAGTAYTKEGSEHRILGKTGTAELKQSLADDTAEENGWFVALNVDDPRLAVAMMIEDVKTRGGSHYVVPLVKKAMNEALAEG